MAADKLRVNIFDMVVSIARVIDMMSPVVGNHHMQVAYLAYRLGEQLQLSADQKYELFLAGSLHDIGAFSLQDRLDLLEFEDTKPGEHSVAKMVNLFPTEVISSIWRIEWRSKYPGRPRFLVKCAIFAVRFQSTKVMFSFLSMLTP